MRAAALGFLFVGGLLLAGQETKPPDSKPAPDYTKDIVPIFEAKCYRCHGTKQKAGGLDMRTLPALLKGGVSGPAMVAGKAKDSIMVDMMHYKEMPPKKEKMPVSKDELDRIKAWIDTLPTEGKK